MSASPLSSPLDAYHALCAYTWTRGDPGFIHQHVVDAFAAQCADERTKPIALTFALVGLYLSVERQWSGRQVQRAHMWLARHKGSWPPVQLPAHRGTLTATDVIREPEGASRDQAIRAWCASVWAAYADARRTIVVLLHQHGIDEAAPGTP